MSGIFCAGLGLFVAAFVLHLVLWKLYRPEAELSPLAKLFLLFPCLAIPLGIVAGVELDWLGWVLALFLYFSLAAAYIQTYPAIASDIPSFQLLLALDESPKKPEELVAVLAQKGLVDSRISKMVVDGFVEMEGTQIKLLAKGRLLAGFFYHYRRLLGRPEGKG